MSYDGNYDGMKKGGRVVKKKGKNVAIAHQVVNVYTGRRGGKRQATAPRQQIIYQTPQIVQQARYNPFPLNDWREPTQNIRMPENYLGNPIRMGQDDDRMRAFGLQQIHVEPNAPTQLRVIPPQPEMLEHPYDAFDLPDEGFRSENLYKPNMGEPVRVQSPPPTPPVRKLPPFSFEPEKRIKDPFEALAMEKLPQFEEKVLKRQLEPTESKKLDDLLMIEGEDLNEPELIVRARPRPIEYESKHEPIFIDELPVKRRRRTKEEMEEARRQGEIKRVEIRQERLETLMRRLSEEKEQKPDSPFIKQIEREIQKLMKR